MGTTEDMRARLRATWAAGDWDDFSQLIAPVGRLVLERLELEPGMKLLDVGCGSGGNLAIPAAQRGGVVVGADVTPELLVHARRRAQDAGVDVDWVEADAEELPFADASFDRVTSTFGAMFASDHRRAAAELVRVCRPGGRIIMTTWVNDGFAGELFTLTGAFMPPPPPGVEAPPLWGVEAHIDEAFGAAGARPRLTRESIGFPFPDLDAAVQRYADDLGPMVAARAVLEAQGRWDEFLGAFTELVERFNPATDGGVTIVSDYWVITVDR